MVKKFNPHITELELSSNMLTDLPDELEDLQYLRSIHLTNPYINSLLLTPPLCF